MNTNKDSGSRSPVLRKCKRAKHECEVAEGTTTTITTTTTTTVVPAAAAITPPQSPARGRKRGRREDNGDENSSDEDLGEYIDQAAAAMTAPVAVDNDDDIIDLNSPPRTVLTMPVLVDLNDYNGVGRSYEDCIAEAIQASLRDAEPVATLPPLSPPGPPTVFEVEKCIICADADARYRLCSRCGHVHFCLSCLNDTPKLRKMVTCPTCRGDLLPMPPTN